MVVINGVVEMEVNRSGAVIDIPLKFKLSTDVVVDDLKVLLPRWRSRPNFL